MADEVDAPGMDLGSNLKIATKKSFKASTGAKKASGARFADKPGKWIILDDNDDIPPTGLYLGHNGNPFLIKVGEPVFVYDFLLEILDHAVMSAPNIDPSTRRVTDYRERPRFTYRVVPEPVLEEE